MQPDQSAQGTSQADNPGPSKVIQQDSRTIIDLRTKDHKLSDLAHLEIVTRPEDVLAEFEHLQESESAKGQV